MILAKETRKPRSGWAVLWPELPFARYLLSGLASLVTDFSVFTALTWAARIDPLIANLVSRPLGGLTCFLMNRHFTFQAAGRSPLPVQFVRFWCVFGMNLALTEGLLALFTKGVGLGPVLGKSIAEGMVVVFTFLALKHWTFRGPPRKGSDLP